MATTEQRILDLATEVLTDIRAVRTEISGNPQGDLSTLATTDKSHIIAAINELVVSIAAVAGASYTDAQADARVQAAKGAPGTPSTSQWLSTNDVLAAIQTAKDDILGGAGAAYDTLAELQAELQGNDADITALLTTVGTKVSYTDVQSLTAAQALQARQNIDAFGSVEIGDPDADFAAFYRAGVDA